jgi:hypothetical protein
MFNDFKYLQLGIAPAYSIGMKGNTNMAKVFEPKRENCTRKPIEEGEEFLFVEFGKLQIAESRQCEECGRQCQINAGTPTTAFPISKLHKLKFFIGSVQEIGWSDELNAGVCEDCYASAESQAVNE